MHVFPSLLQRIPSFQLTVQFPPKKYYFENDFFNIANFFDCIKDTVIPQILLLRYKLLYRQSTFQLISYRRFLWHHLCPLNISLCSFLSITTKSKQTALFVLCLCGCYGSDLDFTPRIILFEVGKRSMEPNI